MTLLDATTWQGTLHSDGWVKPAGGTAPVRSPATGEEIGQVGVANAEDVTRACARAATAQRAWAATGYAVRAAVLRRAGQLFERYAAEIGDWIVRESGSIPTKASVEIAAAAQECYEASALASHPLGEITVEGFVVHPDDGRSRRTDVPAPCLTLWVDSRRGVERSSCGSAPVHQ
ncbi:aldehyde dehydrogenase family protein [Micromonospora sp. NPDC047753]|uniref:aldehyde dehydrogenase family protein n=1 Tax=Micromonospora sp. NPDC047753 TaxID=3154817 RepID=UPI0033D80A5D